ncbi:hypothetical protein PQQ64_14565 [Paraburkholderia graminis]|jgi:hypothetical protein|uniref:hypothetical protein n=1 Tax=Paraburkholderia TaxID=1822464 RepID=UPI0010485789|nr:MULTISPECIES: hypothetical protein [unclassified Paraburkholderia]
MMELVEGKKAESARQKAHVNRAVRILPERMNQHCRGNHREKVAVRKPAKARHRCIALDLAAGKKLAP